jgi:4-hydroxy-3-methylbut-2-enyl diphosphate reductase
VSRVLVAVSAGFCFGVQRAVEISSRTLTEHTKTYMLGKVIHNRVVMEQMERQGAVVVQELSQIPDGATAIVRAHGYAKSGFDEMARRGIDCVDTTCPFVKNIQRIVQKHHEDGFEILVVGDREHPEIQGVHGWCDQSAHIVSGPQELKNALQEPDGWYHKPVCMVGQTTLNQELFEECTKIAKL